MLRKPFLTILAVMAILIVPVSMACSFTVNIPVDDFTPGPTQKMDIQIEEPDAAFADVSLTFGAGEMSLSPGADGVLISGTATYNIEQLKPKIRVNDAKIRLESGDMGIGGIPNFGDGDIKNEWDLEFSDMPMKLMINAGAYQGIYDLGGLSLKSLEVNDGAADVRLKFSEPNRIEMDTLRYVTGASNVKLSQLGNANFTSMIFRGGAGDYTLDFSGEWQRDAVVNVESGISHVVIIVPEGVSARVYFKGGLASINVQGDWDKSGDEYSLQGSGPEIIIHVDMGAGSLELKTTD